eukprot:CAMPEP_0172173356 /NCGR_PEP_ID=MMETSP1050-20130122/13005_1 /TAXON_ID=233186 /ORGANISM="Cryptomonas curvata, Strain CCAP979/52" /LENGTH=103 /DNA_ID=CAMNT_0012845095 /DNA_START=10 /DNA_END=319 /DNA_ORIENTATION=-
MSTRSSNAPAKKPSQTQWNGTWGGNKACPIDISDLVMLHNKASEVLVKTTMSDMTFTPELQSRRNCRHVVPAGDGEASTTISVPSFVVDAKLKKKSFAPQKVE